jgi:hypothetical protein
MKAAWAIFRKFLGLTHSRECEDAKVKAAKTLTRSTHFVAKVPSIMLSDTL